MRRKKKRKYRKKLKIQNNDLIILINNKWRKIKRVIGIHVLFISACQIKYVKKM